MNLHAVKRFASLVKPGVKWYKNVSVGQQRPRKKY